MLQVDEQEWAAALFERYRMEASVLDRAGAHGGTHCDTLQGGSYKRAGDFTSDFSPADGNSGAWDLYGIANSAPELGFVKLQDSGSGTVEGHSDTLYGSSFKRTADFPSDFSPADRVNGSW